MKMPASLLYWVIAGLIGTTCAGCVDEVAEVVPVPLDGRMYMCDAIDSADGRTHFTVERCGAWEGAADVAREIGDEIECDGLGGYLDVWCRSTNQLCDFEPRAPVTCTPEEVPAPPCIIVCGQLPIECAADGSGCSCGDMACEPTGIPVPP